MYVQVCICECVLYVCMWVEDGLPQGLVATLFDH